MAGQFEKLTINQELTPEEITAIDSLKDVKTDDLKSALKTEKLKGVDQTFLEMATAFSTYNVEFSVTEGKTTTDEWGNVITVQSETIAKCDENAPQRLKNLINDKDENDFAYFLYKVSEVLNIPMLAGLEKNKLGLETAVQLISLKTEIEKAPAPIVAPTDNTNNKPTDIITTPTKTPDIVPVVTSEILTKENITFDLKNGVTAEEVIAAVDTLKKTNSELADTIIPLLKTGDVVLIQKILGMKEDITLPLYEQADGKFGSRTLANLKAGKIVGPKEIKKTKEIKNDNIVNEFDNFRNKIDEYGNEIFVIRTTNNLPVSHRRPEKKVYTLSSNGIKYKFYGNGRTMIVDAKGRIGMKSTDDVLEDIIKSELPPEPLKKKATTKEKESKKIETDVYGNEIVPITVISQLPLEKRKETKVYVISKDNKIYKFYGNGRIVADEANYNRTNKIEKNKTNDGWKWKGEVLETEYPAIGIEMNAYLRNTMNTSLSVMYFNDTKKYNIHLSSGIEVYKDDISVDIKNKKISYLGKSIALDKDTPYKELFYIAAKSYELINNRSDSRGDFVYSAGEGTYFNYIKGMKADLNEDIMQKNMQTLMKNTKKRSLWIQFLNDCQDII